MLFGLPFGSLFGQNREKNVEQNEAEIRYAFREHFLAFFAKIDARDKVKT